MLDSLDLGFEDQFCRLLGAKVTCEEAQGSVLDHLVEQELLFCCSSVHPRTFVCKGCFQWFPSPQMEEFQIAVQSRSIVYFSQHSGVSIIVCC